MSNNCESGDPVLESGLPSGSYFEVGTLYSVTYSAVNQNGDESTCTFTIEVLDSQKPDARCQDVVLELDADGNASIVSSDLDAGSYDNCAVGSIVASQLNFDCSNVGLNQILLEVTDTSGNIDICAASVTVQDETAPTIECPADIAVENDPGECGAVVDFNDPTVSDNCGLSFEGAEITFDYTGTEQTWTVPAGVTSIFVDLRGASGGSNNVDGNPNQGGHIEGLGGRLVGNLAVTPGDVIYINAGGIGNTEQVAQEAREDTTAVEPQAQDLAPGGGGGGGASDIRIGGNGLANRKMVAGGGAGEAYNYGSGDDGGNGGDLVGMNGTMGGGDLTTPGAGGSQVSGGAGGSAAYYGFSYLDGSAGGFGFGGSGGADGSGGGGGGGYYGGGGGVWAGGGGGSSFADPSATGVFHTQGFQSGNGLVIIQYSQSASLVQVEGLPSGSIFPVGTTTNVFVVTDGSGNTASCSFDVTVTDDEDPTISCPEDVAITTSNLGTLGDCAGQYAWDHPIASDNCGIDDLTLHTVILTVP
ncbi:MAG: HYR domain-containing protein [Lewinellaceae bacterium]|nr:HYR domain-containing protein [Lewinellaceae bacterium]